ncbi:MAG: hypothetical protein ABEJ92_04710 [Halobacteriales archaeon]
MPSFTTRLADGWDRALDHPALALVPLGTALLATDKVQQVAAFDGAHFGLRLGLPVGIVDLWQFVSVPDQTAGVGLPLPEALPLAAVVVPVAIVVRAALAAGYLGSIAEALGRDTFDFGANVRRYFGPFLGYTLVPLLVVLPLALVGVTSLGAARPLVVLLVPAFIVAAYLFYATPYLIVLRDLDLLAAVRRSYALATAGGPYFQYALGYAGFVLGVSLVGTAVVVNLGLLGVVVGAVAAAPLGLAANAATMRFVADIDAQSPDFGDWDGPDVSEGTRPSGDRSPTAGD